jgi:diguanylate cyclase (GGDEF)-like protein
MGGFQPAGWAGSDNRLWFPSDRGLTSFDPRDLTPVAHALDTYVDEVRLDGKVLSPEDLGELPTRFDSLEIDYTSPQLASAQPVSFRYRLNPYGAWVDAGTRRTAYFSALPPGDVHFEVQARIGNDRFAPPGGAGASLALARNPGWKESRWVVLAAALALIFFLITSQRVLALRAQRREAYLEDLVNRRTRELREVLAQVQTSSRTDSVTGLANRRHLEERLRAIWNLSARSGRPVSAIMIDTDFFKEYNDSLGHTAGDDCLKRIAGALNDGMTRDHDVVGRYGGDEFLILLYDSDASGAARVAECVLEQVRALKLPHPDSEASDFVTITVGYSTARAADEDPNSLIDAADRALYRAKAEGRNCMAGV